MSTKILILISLIFFFLSSLITKFKDFKCNFCLDYLMQIDTKQIALFYHLDSIVNNLEEFNKFLQSAHSDLLYSKQRSQDYFQ